MTETEFTPEEVAKAAQELVDQARGNAHMAASVRPGKTGFAIVNYPGRIPPLDRAAAELLQKEGHEVCISKGEFLNSIAFPEMSGVVGGR